MSRSVDAPAKPMRADARRNYERIVEVATETFLSCGVDASLDEIAKKAGVGAGTLYRHFPTRDLLVAAALRHSMDTLTRDAERDAAELPADEALTNWIRSLARHSGSFKGLPETIIAAGQDADSPLFTTCTGARVVGGRILDRAQREGSVRADLDIDEVFTIATLIAMAGPQRKCQGGPSVDRLITLFLEGISPR
ncbi:TetR/AcrR family transcriptional regulator [Rhodococcus triatomae]|uniref:DNA-binding transcriptional regulator, AcrR family n=1 Tax=Rhodococcus triatomae TaxID=300028 RepID=A0A1G8J1R1_9NOCA|nr:TetR/AcrR family transcriptional regulator [Rhodococcus triatomae]QNG19840.1 TetR/AcrR family transcriptional regulator [Rhodococcus triatomae]QNG24244.1 TetR/AcrR family transcriptional regulator [Rhodococcus triatomae]SDI25126.1 DNA-binding transcriptional regulator, AcrR family [Rhodococcus triatomae]